MERQRLLIINKHQLGTLTDVYKWCYYLREDYDVTLLCFDIGIPKVNIEGVHIEYVDYHGSLKARGIRYILRVLWHILWFKGKIIVVYFEHCDIFKLIFPFRKMILDIRTLSISPDMEKRKKTDEAIISACKRYDMVSVISEGVRNKIGNIGHKVYILPLGADCISCASKNYATLKLIYVGTFNGRQLDKTIEGMSLFCKKFPNVSVTYDIIGSGDHDELETYRRLTDLLHLNDVITFHGRITNHLLAPYFDRTTIGVSFVPITDYYNNQPPTKTFEYILSGLYTIATATDANREVITSDNGILIQDTPEDFARALETIYQKKGTLNERRIRNSLDNYQWKNIVDKYLKPILSQI